MTTQAEIDRIDVAPSPVRAWLYLVWLCVRRHAQVRQMVWIALGLLAFTAVLVSLFTVQGGWGMSRYRWVTLRDPAVGPSVRKGPPAAEKKAPDRSAFLFSNYGNAMTAFEQVAAAESAAAPWSPPPAGLRSAFAGVFRQILDNSGLYVFSTWIVFSIFLSFLLPIWSLSFATEALGGERESRTLVWLLTRPLPRPAIYLAKYVGILPWALGINLGGFALLCLLAGPPGRLALRLYWPAVVLGTLAFCSLFHLFGAMFRRAAVVALAYSFFLETILGNMPGLMKRVSIGFYIRCYMFDAAGDYGVRVDRPTVYLPVSGETAWQVLVGLSVVLLAAGMVVFARREYQDLA
jgi:ABC-2 type transport system permease protein